MLSFLFYSRLSMIEKTKTKISDLLYFSHCIYFLLHYFSLLRTKPVKKMLIIMAANKKIQNKECVANMGNMRSNFTVTETQPGCAGQVVKIQCTVIAPRGRFHATHLLQEGNRAITSRLRRSQKALKGLMQSFHAHILPPHFKLHTVLHSA